MPRLTWNVTNAMYNAASTILASFSGHWVTKPASDLILKLATVGSRTKIPAVPYNTNRHTETNLPTSTALCMLITSTWKKYGQRTDAKKPLIQCEYAHAMGNSQGGFKEYWDLIRKYPQSARWFYLGLR